jgi:hypothetical protein
MKKFLFVLFLFLFLPIHVFAVNMFDVVINEVAWMGTINSANDEWMELKNNTSNSIDLTGWTLQTADEKIVIKLSGTIPAGGFYLLERTDDTTLLDIKANQIYTGSLSNSGQDLWLYDTANNIIDEADFYQGWIFGDNATKQTMERVDNNLWPASNASPARQPDGSHGGGRSDAGWQTSQNPGGSPGAENSETDTSAIPNQTPSPEPNLSPDEPVKPILYPSGVLINEILPNPEGADETDEWIKLYNSNTVDVDLSGWTLEDTNGTVKVFSIPSNTLISAFGFLTFKRPETKIMLNNDADTVILKNPNKETVNSLSFEKAKLGQIYPLKETDSSKKDLPKTENSVKNNNVEAGLADISQGINLNQEDVKNLNPWFLFFTALLITIISAVGILILKFKLIKN